MELGASTICLAANQDRLESEVFVAHPVATGKHQPRRSQVRRGPGGSWVRPAQGSVLRRPWTARMLAQTELRAMAPQAGAW